MYDDADDDADDDDADDEQEQQQQQEQQEQTRGAAAATTSKSRSRNSSSSRSTSATSFFSLRSVMSSMCSTPASYSPPAAHHLTAPTASPLSPKGQKQTEADGMARLREREGRLGVVTHMQLATCAPKNRVTGTGRPSVGHHIHGSQTKEKRS